jgi:hypothetical protein
MKMKRKMNSFFFIFPSNGAPEKTKVLGKKPVPVPLCPPQIPQEPTRDRTRASAVGGRRLTAWAMAQPQQPSYYTDWANLAPETSSSIIWHRNMLSNEEQNCKWWHTKISCLFNDVVITQDIGLRAGLSKRGARMRSLWRAPRSYCAEQKKKG